MAEMDEELLEDDFENVFNDAYTSNDTDAQQVTGLAAIIAALIVAGKLTGPEKAKLATLAETGKGRAYIRDNQLLKLLRLERPTVRMEISPRVILPEKELLRLQQIYNDTRAYNLASNPNTIENLAWRNAQNISERTGMYGMIESDKEGWLHVYQNVYVKVLIPWVTCEDNGNCSSDWPVCEDCQALADEGPYPPDEFPDPPHFKCRCNDPPGEPIFETV